MHSQQLFIHTQLQDVINSYSGMRDTMFTALAPEPCPTDSDNYVARLPTIHEADPVGDFPTEESEESEI